MTDKKKNLNLNQEFLIGVIVGLSLLQSDPVFAGLAEEVTKANDFIFGSATKVVLALGTIVSGGSAIAAGKPMLAGGIALTGVIVGVVLGLIKDGQLSIGTS